MNLNINITINISIKINIIININITKKNYINTHNFFFFLVFLNLKLIIKLNIFNF